MSLLLNAVDTWGWQVYNQPIVSQKVVDSGGLECSTGNMNTALIEKVGSLSPVSSERYSKKIMWNDFSSLGVWIRVSLYSRKMNGKNKKADFGLFPLPAAKRANSIAFIFRAPARLLATVKGAF